MPPFADPPETPDSPAGLQQFIVPDLWQQQAVSALRAGKDVIIHAPTGAGKTLIFELWSKAGKNRGQAIYTVPTRALANDKLAEWRGRGWNVGIATGDLATRDFLRGEVRDLAEELTALLSAEDGQSVGQGSTAEHPDAST